MVRSHVLHLRLQDSYREYQKLRVCRFHLSPHCITYETQRGNDIHEDEDSQCFTIDTVKQLSVKFVDIQQILGRSLHFDRLFNIHATDGRTKSATLKGFSTIRMSWLSSRAVFLLAIESLFSGNFAGRSSTNSIVVIRAHYACNFSSAVDFIGMTSNKRLWEMHPAWLREAHVLVLLLCRHWYFQPMTRNSQDERHHIKKHTWVSEGLSGMSRYLANHSQQHKNAVCIVGVIRILLLVRN